MIKLFFPAIALICAQTTETQNVDVIVAVPFGDKYPFRRYVSVIVYLCLPVDSVYISTGLYVRIARSIKNTHVFQ